MSFAHPHSESYVRALKTLPGVELLGADPDHRSRPCGEAGGAELAQALGVDYVETYSALLQWQPDGVIVCSENSRHRDLVELAAVARAHILCEKPLATSLLDARAMITRCSEAGVNLMMAYPVRFSPAFAGLKAAVDAGSLGEVAAVSGTNTGRLPSGRTWFMDPQLSGGGSLMDHTVHVADLLDCLFGQARPESVYATLNHLLQSDLVKVETGGLVSLRFPNGAVATIDCSWSKPASYPTWGGLTLQLVGSDIRQPGPMRSGCRTGVTSTSS